MLKECCEENSGLDPVKFGRGKSSGVSEACERVLVIASL
jgi:hypothetical protein